MRTQSGQNPAPALKPHEHPAITSFLMEPQVRFKGLTGEQATMFFLYPSGNALEFKAFGDLLAQVFAK